MRYEIRILKLLFPSILFTTTDREIHLTFDDGPHPVATPAVLDILKIRGIYATFFLTGQNVREYPDIARRVKSEGHQIGNHSYIHASLFFKKKEIVQKQIQQTAEVLESIVGKHSRAFRPPYGYFNLTTLRVLEELGLTCVMWSINSKDYRSSTQASIERRVIPHITNGSILLFHDNRHTAQVLHTYLPVLLDTLIGKGFIFNTLPL